MTKEDDVRATTERNSQSPASILDFVPAEVIRDQSVLVVGKGSALICLDAYHRGARVATGYEPFAATLDHLPPAARAEAAISLRILGKDALPPPSSFDYAFLLDGAKRASIVPDVAAAAYKQFVAEFVVPKRSFAGRLRPLLKAFPTIGSKVLGSWWPLPGYSPSALQWDLVDKRLVLSAVRFLPCVQRHSILLSGTRRRHRNLLFIAGPDASGKTTLTRKILNGEIPSGLDSMPLGNQQWHVAAGGEPSFRSTLEADNLLVNYNLFRPLPWRL